MTTQPSKILNPKEHFVLNDSFDNIVYDVDFSIFKKYMCRAGCDICYIQNDWLPSDKFQKYIPIQNGRPHIDRLLNFFEYFDVVSTIDDLRYVRDEHPGLFRFYQEYGSVFHLSSMSDNAIMRHLPIIQNEIVPRGIREISISEYFMSKVNMVKLLKALDAIQSKAAIIKIKAILSPQNEKPVNAQMLMDWCAVNDVKLEKQFEHGADIEKSTSLLSSVGDSRFNEQSNFSESQTYSEDFGEIFPIHSELLFLMYDEFYSELKSATVEGRSTAFANLADFDDPVQFLVKILEGKLADYRRYISVMKNKESTYYKYFKYVVDHLVINKDFNFVPRVAFKPYSPYHKQLVNSAKMIDTAYGLLKPNTEVVVPIYTFKEHEPNTF